jgi:NAD-dependent deacetylase
MKHTMPELSPVALNSIRSAAAIIRGSKNAVVLTGAGISTPSGIPDFRSTSSGLWQKYDPFEVASLSSFRYNPENFFKWMRPLATDIFAAHPNPAHVSLAEMEKLGYVKTIVTQNIDLLHRRAGSQNVLEVHGSFASLTCVRCYHQFASDCFIQPYLEEGKIPVCPDCQGLLKPDLVLFGEQLPVKIWLKAQQACKTCDLMIVAGSSLEVLPVAGLPMRALENGAHLILINHSETYLDVRADVLLHEDLDLVFPHILQALLDESIVSC